MPNPARSIFRCVSLALCLGLASTLPAQTRVAGAGNPTDRRIELTLRRDTTRRAVALVIGNGAYASARLANPVNDAHDVADSLRDLGFHVMYQSDASEKVMKRLVRAFRDSISRGGIALFYYAGHGVQVKGKNYLMPVDAQIESETDVELTGIDLDGILGYMEEAGSNLNILIVDACRNNPFRSSFRSQSSGLAQLTNVPIGTYVAFATAPGQTASDGTGRNGLFTEVLLGTLKSPGLSLLQIFQNVTKGVTARSGRRQVPWVNSTATEDFVLVTAPERPAPIAPPVGVIVASEGASVGRALNATRLIVGGTTSCVFETSPTPICWGQRNSQATSRPTLTGVDSIHFGRGHGCGVRRDVLVCWGDNTVGQLGDGSTTTSDTARKVQLSFTPIAIATGSSHTCAISPEFAVWCWGSNSAGQLGDGSTTARRLPTRIDSANRFRSIVAGSLHTCALTALGEAWCWGDGFLGQLGSGLRQGELKPRPVKMPSGTVFASLSAGTDFTCGLAAQGRAWCWGDNRAGQIGDGSTRERLEPSDVKRLSFTEITTGGLHVCALTDTKEMWCWGNNASGQLGNGSRTNRTTATLIPYERSVQHIAAGSSHTCATTREDGVVCWGDNGAGQLGRPRTEPQATPVVVRVP